MASRRRLKVTARFYTLLLVALLALLTVNLVQGILARRGLEREVEGVEASLDAMRVEVERLESEVTEMESDAYVERRAREDLGLVMPGEERYQVVPAE